MAWNYHCVGCGCSLDPAEGRLCEDCRKIEKAHRKIAREAHRKIAREAHRTREQIQMDQDGQYKLNLLEK